MPNGPFSNAAKRKDAKMYRLADRKSVSSKSRTTAEYEVLVPKKMERTSKDTANTYTVLLSRLPSWRGWPRRSFSVIFFLGRPSSSDYQYGSEIYRLYPRNKAKIVVSPNPDLLNSHVFKHMEEMMRGPTHEISDIQSFSSALMNVVTWSVIAKDGIENNPEVLDTEASKRASAWMRNIRYDNYDKAISVLDKALNKKTLPKIHDVLTKAFESATVSNWRKSIFDNYKELFQYYVEQTEKYGGWEGFLSEAFDPEKNGFQLMTTENVNITTAHNEVECWTEDTCMLKHVSLWEPYADEEDDYDETD
jgi:hypothetical protein